MDFIVGMPQLDEKMAILTVSSSFIKYPPSVSPLKLPPANETAELFLVQVFELHGSPVDVVSDREPQFYSVFWWELCISEPILVVMNYISFIFFINSGDAVT